MNAEQNQLPHNRFQVFADRLKVHWIRFLSCGLLLIVFLLPLFAVGVYADLTAASLQNSLSANEITRQDYNSSILTLQLFASLANIVGWLVFAAGLAGVMRLIRQTAWSQQVLFWKDFALGVKQNVRGYLLLFFVVGLLNAFNTVVMQMYDGVLQFLPLCLYTFVLLPIIMHALVQLSIYNHKLWDILSTSAFVYVKTVPISILFSVLFMSYGLFDMLSFAAGYMLKLLFVLVLPVGILAWILYCCCALDKYVNAQNYPNLVDKGVWRT